MPPPTRGKTTKTASATDGASIYKGPVGPLRHRCPLCPTAASQLLLCTGCRAFRYCSRDHQVAHRPQHKSACAKTKNARTKLAKEDHDVRNATPDSMTPANAFETAVGHFWGIPSTCDYMRARDALAGQLLELGTLDGVQEALDHMQDMVRLCRSDNMGLRSIMPAVMLRLDLDQECYDFIKWWATCDPDGRYDWSDMTLPHLNIHGADVLEDPVIFIGDVLALDHIIAHLILKLKLLVDIINLKITRKVLAQSRLPSELRDQIERGVVRSPLSAKFQKEPPGSLSKIEITLLNHIRQLGSEVNTNSDFMRHLFDPDEALSYKPKTYSRSSRQEMALAIQFSYAAWWETEGVLNLLNNARAIAARDLRDEMTGCMRNREAKEGRIAEGMLEGLSLNGVWEYLDTAVQDAAYLGPRSERPSERHARAVEEFWANAKAEVPELLAMFEALVPDDETY
ncbi:hypothetical protein F5Y10DRAFT_238604 [Nemania abortiva]|nr:hypothetical protein F5Y10DRAFT_238604 [Nemania abortiva]